VNIKMKFGQLYEICLDITNRCAMSCIHCSSFGPLTSREEMSFRDIQQVLVDFASLGGSVVDISGGEPTMRRDLHGIIGYANSLGLETRLYTSGIVFGRNGKAVSIDSRMSQELKNSGVDKVILNLQGARKETHERVTRCRGSFSNVNESIAMLKSMDMWVGVHFVPMKPNFSELADVAHLCISQGVDELGILRFVPQGRGEVNKRNLELDRYEFKRLVERIIRLKRLLSRSIEIRIGRPLDFCSIIDNSRLPLICNAGVSTCLIKPNGDVVPCPAFKQNPHYIAGNVLKRSFKDIWNQSPILKAFREFQYEKLSGPCNRCPHIFVCRGRCAAQRILRFHDIYGGPDPLCFLHKTEDLQSPMVFSRKE